MNPALILRFSLISSSPCFPAADLAFTTYNLFFLPSLFPLLLLFLPSFVFLFFASFLLPYFLPSYFLPFLLSFLFSSFLPSYFLFFIRFLSTSICSFPSYKFSYIPCSAATVLLHLIEIWSSSLPSSSSSTSSSSLSSSSSIASLSSSSLS